MNIRESCLQGVIPEDLKIFDAHSHIGEGEYGLTYLYQLPIAESIRLARKIGIRKMAASSMRALCGDSVSGNARLFEILGEHPDFLCGYAHYAPQTGKEGLRAILAYLEHPGFVGVKIHPREDHSPLGEGCYDALWPFAAEHDILILCHTWQEEPDNDPALFSPILEKYPTLRLLLGHSGGTRRGVLTSCALAGRYENVCLDINGSLYSETWIEELALAAGTDKLVFGSDQTFNDPKIALGRVLLSNLSDPEKRDILYYNFERLTGRKFL